MVVQHNMTAINANRYLGINNNKLSKSLREWLFCSYLSSVRI